MDLAPRRAHPPLPSSCERLTVHETLGGVLWLGHSIGSLGVTVACWCCLTLGCAVPSGHCPLQLTLGVLRGGVWWAAAASSPLLVTAFQKLLCTEGSVCWGRGAKGAGRAAAGLGLEAPKPRKPGRKGSGLGARRSWRVPLEQRVRVPCCVLPRGLGGQGPRSPLVRLRSRAPGPGAGC